MGLGKDRWLGVGKVRWVLLAPSPPLPAPPPSYFASSLPLHFLRSCMSPSLPTFSHTLPTPTPTPSTHCIPLKTKTIESEPHKLIVRKTKVKTNAHCPKVS